MNLIHHVKVVSMITFHTLNELDLDLCNQIIQHKNAQAREM